MPELALLGREPRPMVAPDAVLVADRAAVRDDRLARRRLQHAAIARGSRPGRSASRKTYVVYRLDPLG